MSTIKRYLDEMEAQQGFKAKLRRRLFGSMINGLRAAQADIETNESLIADCESRLGAVSAQLAELQNRSDIAAETANGMHRDLEGVSTNVRNNNTMIERLSSESELLKLTLNSIKKSMSSPAPAAPAAGNVQAAPAVQASAPAAAESDYESIDYFDFENHFRGPIENIKKSQEFYLKYFRGRKNVVDIGCGRGEFLSLMQDNGINAQGVDIYEPYADYCNMKGLKAACGDGSDFLSKLTEVDGIFVGQVVEHLRPHEIIRLCNTAYEKLTEGGIIAIETPNPTSLAIYTNAFYIDPSHIKPVHPLTMKYYLEKAGFRKIEIVYTEGSRVPMSIPELKGTGEDTQEFNEAMKRVSELLFGSQDYAVIAEKG